MINEQTLMLYYFGDGLDQKRRQKVSEALQRDHALADRYAALCKDLDAMKNRKEAPTPTGFKQAWHQIISEQAARETGSSPEAARMESSSVVEIRSVNSTTAEIAATANEAASPNHMPAMRSGPPAWLSWGGALAAMLVLGMAIGVLIKPGGDPLSGSGLAGSDISSVDNSEGSSANNGQSGSFKRGLAVYLQESQDSLEMLDEEAIDKQKLIRDIVAQNRLLARVADTSNAPEIARLIRALEPVLYQLADEQNADKDDGALRRQLDFELQAMLTKIEHNPSNEAPTI